MVLGHFLVELTFFKQSRKERSSRKSNKKWILKMCAALYFEFFQSFFCESEQPYIEILFHFKRLLAFLCSKFEFFVRPKVLGLCMNFILFHLLENVSTLVQPYLLLWKFWIPESFETICTPDTKELLVQLVQDTGVNPRHLKRARYVTSNRFSFQKYADSFL
jgi:hypothetical protein